MMIKLIPPLSYQEKQKCHPKNQKQNSSNNKKNNNNNNKTRDPLPHVFMKDTIRHNTAQIISTSKVYIPYLFTIIIKWCNIITRDTRQYRNSGHKGNSRNSRKYDSIRRVKNKNILTRIGFPVKPARWGRLYRWFEFYPCRSKLSQPKRGVDEQE